MLIERTWTLLHYTSYIVNIGLNFQNIREGWKSLRQDHHSTTKVFILFDIIMNFIDIGATCYTLNNKRSENTYTSLYPALKNQLDGELYQQGTQLLQRASSAWHQSKSPETIPPLSLQKAQEVFEKLHTLVQYHRYMNFQFEIAQGISLLTRLVRHVMKNGFLTRVDLLVQLILEKATAILSYHSKAYGNNDSQLFSNGLLSPLRKVSNIASNLIGLSMLLEPYMGPLSIRWKGIYYTRFILPSDLTSGVGYSKISDQYANRAASNLYYCHATQKPITKALIIWKKEQFYYFEKEALLTHIIQSKSNTGPWKIPETQIMFEASELYEDKRYDARIGNALRDLTS